MSDIFTRPNFFGERFVPELDSSFVEGSITTVRSLKDLPPNVLEKIPDIEEVKSGYVVKQYNKDFDPNFSKHDLVLFERTRLSSDNYAEFTLIDKATILKKRQDELCRYFEEKGAEHVIVNSHFFIARDEDSEFYLYEIQEKIPDYVSLENHDSIDLETFDSATRQHFLSEVEKLEQILSALLSETNDPTFKTFVPDFHPQNIAITNEGEIRIFDTNYWGFQWSSFVPAKVEKSVQILRKLKERLKQSLAEK